MTEDALLGVGNDRANWSLQELDAADAVLLWRTDGPGHHVAVCNLNGWHVSLCTTIEVGEERVLVCGMCGEQHPDGYVKADDDPTRCRECGEYGEPSTFHVGPAAALSLPIQLYLDVDPADVAGRVEQLQRTSESVVEPEP